MRLYASEIAAAADGVIHGADGAFDGASIDSRSIGEGQMFVAVVAERDGHDFVPAAVSSGAAAVMTSRRVADLAVPVIEVDDTGLGLEAAGRLARSTLADRVVGITGSVGKTSVKDLTAAVLGTSYRTAASVRSFNNELGVPLTLLNAPADTTATVVEMGARGVGHIARLCRIAGPTIGVVTAVAPVHTELFGTVEEVARAKGELIEALPSDGTAVLNADDPAVAAMATRSTASVLTFGRAGDIRAGSITTDDLLRPRFVIEFDGDSQAVTLSISGRHNVSNALAAVGVGVACGLDLATIAGGLETATLSPWRMELRRTAGGATVINDAYNANPTSVRAALDALAALRAVRRTAVLGEMGELGEDSDRAHLGVARYAVELGIEVVAVGAPSYGPDAVHVSSFDEALGELEPVGTDDALLVKASRSVGLERLVERLAPRPG